MQSLLLLLYHRYHLSELQDWGLTPIALGMGYLCVLVLSHSLEQSKDNINRDLSRRRLQALTA